MNPKFRLKNSKIKNKCTIPMLGARACGRGTRSNGVVFYEQNGKS